MVAPKLRFKEFDGDWELDLLGNLVQIKSGYSPSKYELDKSGEMPFLKVEELNNCDKYQEYSRFYTERNSDAVPSKSVVFPKRGAAILNNKVRILRVDALLDSNLMALIPQHSLDAEYLYYLINKIELYKIADTSTIPQINNKHIEPYSIYLPSKEEQTKIASFLSAVDEKINQLTQKHQLLSQYKQGMMQKLFSQQIRFKADDGSEFGEWEETILSDIVNLFHGYQFRTSDFTSKGIAVIKIGNVIGNNLDLANLTYVNENRLEDFKKFEILNGDILMSLTGNIGRIIEVKNKPFIILQNYRVGKFIPLNENFLIKPFLKYLLTSDLVFGRFSQLANQSAQANFGKQDMDKIAVFYPSVSEQTKIANFLSSIDQKIDVVSEQLEQAKLWKKGLLQQMFV